MLITVNNVILDVLNRAIGKDFGSSYIKTCLLYEMIDMVHVFDLIMIS